MENKVDIREEIRRTVREIREIMERNDSWPKNEATTCDRVIVPLLQAAGYTAYDYDRESTDNAGQIPDFTFLHSDTDHTWYLEAKRWGLPLQDAYAQQSINYANNNGKRWVVLSNGQVWRLYDNRIAGTASEKMTAEAELNNEDDVVLFLEAISKSSVTSGDLGRFSRQSQLRSVLNRQLTDPNSDSIKVLHKALKKLPNLGDLSIAEVADFFKTPDALTTIPIGLASSQLTAVISGQTYSLDDLKRRQPDLHEIKPAQLTLPGGETRPVSKWVDLVEEVVGWFADQEQLRMIPFPQGRTLYFLNNKPEHLGGRKMRQKRTVSYQGQTIFIDVDTGTHRKIDDLVALCKAADILPGDIKITLA